MSVLHRLTETLVKLLQASEPVGLALLSQSISCLELINDDSAWWVHGAGSSRIVPWVSGFSSESSSPFTVGFECAGNFASATRGSEQLVDTGDVQKHAYRGYVDDGVSP